MLKESALFIHINVLKQDVVITLLKFWVGTRFVLPKDKTLSPEGYSIKECNNFFLLWTPSHSYQIIKKSESIPKTVLKFWVGTQKFIILEQFQVVTKLNIIFYYLHASIFGHTLHANISEFHFFVFFQTFKTTKYPLILACNTKRGNWVWSEND